MRSLIFLFFMIFAVPAFAKCPSTTTDCPSPTFNNVTIGGTLNATISNVGASQVTATDGTTGRTLANSANDPGFSVLSMGAKCDGVTDDTTAMQNALNSGHKLVTIPAGVTCYSLSGVTVPYGVTLQGTWQYYRNPPTGSQIQCLSTVVQCVTLGDGSANTPVALRNLVVSSDASSTPSGNTGVYINGGFNVTLEHVAVFNMAIGYYWKAGLTVGVASYAHDIYAGHISDAYAVADSWAEIHVDHARFGTNGIGDFHASAYVRILGGFAGGGGGPNTIYFSNSQFNQGGGTQVDNFLQFKSCTSPCVGGGGVNATEYQFINNHVETIGSAFISSDSTWNCLCNLRLIGNSMIMAAKPFWALDAATGLNNLGIIGNYISASSFTLTPTPQINDNIIASNTLNGALSITSNASGSTLSLSNNTYFGAMTLAGPWAALSVTGGDIRGGSITNNATGSVMITVPGQNAQLVGPVAVNGPTKESEAGPLVTIDDDATASMTLSHYNGGSGTRIRTRDTASATYGSHGAVSSGDGLAGWIAEADDGTNFNTKSGQIIFSADSTVSAGIVPGRLSLSTANTSGVMSEAFRIDSSQNVRMFAGGQVGSSGLTLSPGEFGFNRDTSSASAPGAAGAKLAVVCGTNAGTAKLIVYAGTSSTPVTVTDNIGSGVTGC